MTEIEEAALRSVIRLHKEAEAERDEARKAARFVFRSALGLMDRTAASIWKDNLCEQYPWLKDGDG